MKNRGEFAYCHSCRTEVRADGKRCPDCRRILWELWAHIPDENSEPLRTKPEDYRRFFEAMEKAKRRG